MGADTALVHERITVFAAKTWVPFPRRATARLAGDDSRAQKSAKPPLAMDELRKASTTRGAVSAASSSA
jgi:hypothetical protein